MRYKAAIFDLDGTLLNTLDDLADSMNAVLRTHDLPVHPVDSYRLFVGEGAAMLVTRALPGDRRNEKTIEALLAEFRAVYAQGWKIKTRPYPGIVELLTALSDRGFPLAVLSNKPDDATVNCVRHFFPGVAFAAVRGHTPGVPRKPDPTGALMIAQSLGLDPGTILYAGDSSIDMKTASSAGMYPLGVLWGFRSRGELVEHGARGLAGDPAEIGGLLASSLDADIPPRLHCTGALPCQDAPNSGQNMLSMDRF